MVRWGGEWQTGVVLYGITPCGYQEKTVTLQMINFVNICYLL